MAWFPCQAQTLGASPSPTAIPCPHCCQHHMESCAHTGGSETKEHSWGLSSPRNGFSSIPWKGNGFTGGIPTLISVPSEAENAQIALLEGQAQCGAFTRISEDNQLSWNKVIRKNIRISAFKQLQVCLACRFNTGALLDMLRIYKQQHNSVQGVHPHGLSQPVLS